MSEYSLNLNEIFGIAEKIEQNGAKFYGEAAEIFKDHSEVYNLLLRLKGEEEHHEEVFGKYKEKFIRESRIENELDPMGLKYIKSLAGQFVFNEKNNRNAITPETTKSEVFDFAINREKDAILFYLGLKDAMVEEKDKVAVDALIKEEQRHLADLTEYKQKYSKLL